MHIIAGSSNLPLAQKIARQLQTEVIDCELSSFGNGEKRVWIKDGDLVKGHNVAIVQSFSRPVDDNIMETLIMADALARLGVKEIFLVIPWMGYSLQDKVFRPGESIAAKVVADLISGSQIDRVFLLDLHNHSIPAFFSIPAYYLSAEDLFVEHVKKNYALDNATVASPDFGGLKKSKSFAKKLQLPLFHIDKSRDLTTGEVTSKASHGGSVQGKTVFVLDDVIVSGSTVVKTAELLKEEGAKEIIFLASHGIFCENSLQKILSSQADKIVISNSIAQESDDQKLQILDLSDLFAQALRAWV